MFTPQVSDASIFKKISFGDGGYHDVAYTSPQLVSHGTQTLADSPEATTSVAASGHPVTATLASQNPESEAGLTGPRPGPLDTSVSSIV